MKALLFQFQFMNSIFCIMYDFWKYCGGEGRSGPSGGQAGWFLLCEHFLFSCQGKSAFVSSLIFFITENFFPLAVEPHVVYALLNLLHDRTLLILDKKTKGHGLLF